MQEHDQFNDFRSDFRSSHSTADLSTIVVDMIAKDLFVSGAIGAVVLDISKTFGRFSHAGFLHNLKFYGISDSMFNSISSLLVIRSFVWF